MEMSAMAVGKEKPSKPDQAAQASWISRAVRKYRDLWSRNKHGLIRRLLWFLNFRNMIRVTMWALPWRRNRTFIIFEGREYTYGDVYRQSGRYADFFLQERKIRVQSGRLGDAQRLCVGIYTDNNPEFLFASFGAGLSNTILFAINRGFRGETLARVIDQADLSLLIMNRCTVEEVERVIPDVHALRREDILFAGKDVDADTLGFRSVERALACTDTEGCWDYMVPIDNFSPSMVIYTSGITGLPKGVPCAHIKLLGAAFKVWWDTGLRCNDRGYISMPLFHSNAWYCGMLPLLIAGGSFVLTQRFSARAFEPDILKYGVTFLNYVGQPLHYVIDALEKGHGNSPEGVEAALAHHPLNKLRLAYGNGATALDRKKLVRYLGVRHVYEVYGSTEAVITTALRPGDPIESVGRAPGAVVILDSAGRVCPPGIAGENGELVNYDQAVGEICSDVGVGGSLRFEGYYGNAGATSHKFRNGIFHSGDLGHVRLVGGRRYLYFNGRTDDWIRKDGENFSAEDVLRYAQAIPGVQSAVAYGAPCEVSDEKVMIAIQLTPGAVFDPDDVFSWFMRRQMEGGMDPKWMPDYIRIVERFTFVTQTQKIIVRPYKRAHFNIESDPGMEVWYRQRGDTSYKRLTMERFQDIKGAFAKNGREGLLV